MAASKRTPRETRERFGTLHRIEAAASVPLSVLGFVWLFLVIYGLVAGYAAWLQTVTYAIWAIFLADFSIRLTIAPHKLRFLKQNALLAVSLLLPALGMLQVLRVFSMFPAWEATIVRIVAGAHRSIKILGATMHRRGLAYAVLLTAIVTFAGAAGMYQFERTSSPGPGIYSPHGSRPRPVLSALGVRVLGFWLRNGRDLELLPQPRRRR